MNSTKKKKKNEREKGGRFCYHNTSKTMFLNLLYQIICLVVLATPCLIACLVYNQASAVLSIIKKRMKEW